MSCTCTMSCTYYHSSPGVDHCTCSRFPPGVDLLSVAECPGPGVLLLGVIPVSTTSSTLVLDLQVDLRVDLRGAVKHDIVLQH